MKENLIKDTLQLMKIPGLSGYEDRVRKYLKDEIEALGLSTITDKLGNLRLQIPGNGPCIMIFTHMDQLGLVVRRIDEDGFLWFERLGGVPEKMLPGQPVLVSARSGQDFEGVIGIKSHHATGPNEKYTVNSYKDLYVDLGYGSKDAVKALGINIGSPIVYKPSAEMFATDKICGTSVDDRAGCAVLLELIRHIKNGDNGGDIHIVFTVQEEFNLRGALPAAQQIQPDIALQIDLILASDTPDMKDFGEVKLGDGPALSMFSFHGRGTLNGVIPNPELVNYIEKTAAQEGITLQKSAHIGALTDLSYVQLVNDGVVCADLGFPMRYSHSSHEMCDVNDLVGLTQLLVSFVKGFQASFQLIREE